MGRLLKFFIGLLLIPVCAGFTLTLIALIRPMDTEGPAHLLTAFLIGFGLWIFLYLCLPRPARSYVLAHELTHAVWASWFGARVLGMKVGRDEGHVLLSTSNFLISLAPYFFPFYTFCTLLLYGLLSLAWDMTAYSLFWVGLIGLSWAYHLTFTVSALKSGQEDVREHGAIFSMPVIYLGNAITLCIGVMAVSSPSLEDFAHQTVQDQTQAWTRTLNLTAPIQKHFQAP